MSDRLPERFLGELGSFKDYEKAIEMRNYWAWVSGRERRVNQTCLAGKVLHISLLGRPKSRTSCLEAEEGCSPALRIDPSLLETTLNIISSAEGWSLLRLLEKIFHYEPDKRPSAEEIAKNGWITGNFDEC